MKFLLTLIESRTHDHPFEPMKSTPREIETFMEPELGFRFTFDIGYTTAVQRMLRQDDGVILFHTLNSGYRLEPIR